MRDGLRTLTELVDRIEGGGVIVDDVSLSRTDEGNLSADVSIKLSDDAAMPSPVDDHETDGGRVPRSGGVEAESSQTVRDGAHGPDEDGGVSASFGTISTSVGGSVAKRFADATAPDDRSDRDDADAQDDGTAETGSGSSSDDEPITCRVDGCEESFPTEHGMKIHATKAHQAADGSAPSPHRDPERLREVYEAHDTFEEMTAALDVDVTPQTVRRSMMRLGVHDPHEDGEGSPGYEGTPPVQQSETVQSTDEPVTDDGTGDATGTDGTDEQPVDAAGTDAGAERDGDPVENSTDDPAPEDSASSDEGTGTGTDDATDAPDGDPADAQDGDAVHASEGDAADAPAVDVDDLLPASVDGDTFVTAVREASTLYEVQRRLEMDREEVQNLLAEYGLLDLVHGRVATQHEREDRKAEIERRIVERTGDDGGDEGPDESAGDGPGEPASAD